MCILVDKPERTRSLGRPRGSELIILKCFLEKWDKVAGLIHLAQDGDYRRSLAR
jgi:hypothetical protein